ncbi:MAG: leucine-rich repeat domain-containing protein [Acetatifactor sp.]|nr:leucine-rich repeat domain-containing protein [Acetatifactor sp.]
MGNSVVSEQEITDEENTLENIVNDEAIIFVYPAIEEKTRELLEKPEGVITKTDVLAITEFEMDAECAAPFQDLQWYENLERVRLHDCGVKSLDGVERLTALKYLWVRDNDITDIELVRELTDLVEFACAGNPVSDYSPVSGLINLEELQIGDNGFSYTDINFVSDLTKLTSLYAPWCGIEDISVLENLTEVEYLNLRHNQIEDVNVLGKLEKLTYLNLEWNQIEDVSELGKLDKLTNLNLERNQVKDITPLYGLNRLEHISLERNEISEEELALFFEEKRGKLFTVTQTGSLREDMPEFTFDLSAYFDLERGTYALQSLDVTKENTVIQTISIPELTLFGQTYTYDSMRDTLGFELEDVNFDGYQDIRLFDTSNGNYRQEWIYLVWNPKEEQFEHDARLNEISLASFDQENKLIYGMERGSAARHYYSTYQYIDGEPVIIRYVKEEELFFSDEQTKQYCMAASEKEEAIAYEGYWIYLHVMERNGKTGELETVSEEYVFYPEKSEGTEAGEEFHVNVESELGQQIKARAE